MVSNVLWGVFYRFVYLLWHYLLWSFKTRDKKLERFLHKNQHNQRTLLNFENWTNREPQQLAKIRVFKVLYPHLKTPQPVLLQCAMIAFSRVFLSFISAFSDNNLGNCTRDSSSSKAQNLSECSTFFIPKDSPLNRQAAPPRHAAPSPQLSHRVYLSKSALCRAVRGISRTEGYFSFTHKTLERKTFASGIHFFPNKYISFTILILRLPLSLFLSRKMQSYVPHPSSQSAALGSCCPKQAKRSKKKPEK